MHTKGDHRNAGRKMGWTKPLPSAWPMGIDRRLDLWQGSHIPRSGEAGAMLCGIAMSAVSYDDVGG
jgi:hypothetical protein